MWIMADSLLYRVVLACTRRKCVLRFEWKSNFPFSGFVFYYYYYFNPFRSHNNRELHKKKKLITQISMNEWMNINLQIMRFRIVQIKWRIYCSFRGWENSFTKPTGLKKHCPKPIRGQWRYMFLMLLKESEEMRRNRGERQQTTWTGNIAVCRSHRDTFFLHLVTLWHWGWKSSLCRWEWIWWFH